MSNLVFNFGEITRAAAGGAPVVHLRFAWLKCVRNLVFLMVLMGVCGSGVHGQTITTTIEQVTVPTGTQTSPAFVIDSDATTTAAGTTRDSIATTVRVRFDLSGTGSTSGRYRVAVELLDDSGQPVSLDNATSGTTLLHSGISTISVSDATPTTTVNFTVNPVPGVDLGAGSTYRVKAHLQREFSGLPPGNQPFFGAVADLQSPGFTVVHFQDLGVPAANRNVRVYLRGSPTFTRRFSVQPDPLGRRFVATIPFTAARYDPGDVASEIPLRLQATVTDDLGNNIPLAGGGLSAAAVPAADLAAFVAGAPNAPAVRNGTLTVEFQPTAQLASRARTFHLRVGVSHQEVPASSTFVVGGSSLQSAANRLLHFNGNLHFGEIAATFNSITNSPTVLALGAGFVDTSIAAKSGSVTEFGYGFSSNAVLRVNLLDNGNCVVTTGEEILDSPVEAGFPNGQRVTYQEVHLGAAGPVAQGVRVQLPQGLSYTPARANSGGRYFPYVDLPGARALTTKFRHTGTVTGATPADAWIFDEARPLEYRITQFSFEENGNMVTAADDAEWCHSAAIEKLAVQTHLSPETMSIRRTNEGYLRFARLTAPRTFTFVRAADGTARTKTADVEIGPADGPDPDLNPVGFRTHFPHDVLVRWTGGGTLEIRDGKITNGTACRLTGASPLTMTYSLVCDDDGNSCSPLAGVIRSLALTPGGSTLKFTPDGGIYAPVSFPAAALEWGIKGLPSGLAGAATHRTSSFTVGNFVVSGNQGYQIDIPVFSSAAFEDFAGEMAPASVLLSGYDPFGAGTIIRPESAAYASGSGFYPGLNCGVGSSGQVGAYRLADMAEDRAFTLRQGASKYYVRPSGISGRHAAENSSLSGGFHLYGYRFILTGFQTAVLGNDTVDSRIHGALAVPRPLQPGTEAFTQAFRNLKLNCVGHLEEAEIDPSDLGPKPFAYWGGEFTPHALRFATVDGGDCFTNRVLTIGLSTLMENIEEPVHGILAFKADGNLGTMGEGIDGTDGRLGLPSVLTMAGPRDEIYSLIPVSKIYFNNPAVGSAPESGFAGFAATVGVPFFENLPVHATTRPRVAGTAPPVTPLSFAGGWTEGGETFFTRQNFDAAHRGFPPTSQISPSIYLNPILPTPAVDPYLPQGKQSLFGIVPLQYPLLWNKVSRSFSSPRSKRDPLLILDLDHKINNLSAEIADIGFGAQFDGVARVNLASLLTDAGSAWVEVFGQAATNQLVKGVSQLSGLLGDEIVDLLDAPLDAATNDVFAAMHAEMIRSLEDNPVGTDYSAWLQSRTTQLKSIVSLYVDSDTTPAPTLNKQLTTLIADLDYASSLANKITESVTFTIEGIDDLLKPDGIFSKSITGQRPVMKRLVASAAGANAPPPVKPLFDSVIAGNASPLASDIDAWINEDSRNLDDLEQFLRDSREFLVAFKREFHEVGPVLVALRNIEAAAQSDYLAVTGAVRNEAHAMIDRAAEASQSGLVGFFDGSADLMVQIPEEAFKQRLRAKLRDALVTTNVVKQVQLLLRQRVSDAETVARGMIDGVFDRVNAICRKAIAKVAAPLDDSINAAIGDDVGAFFGAGKVTGYAQFTDFTLRKIHLDAKAEFKIPDPLALDVYFDMFCFDSDVDTGCTLSGGSGVEVKVGARNVPLDFLPAGAKKPQPAPSTPPASGTPAPKPDGIKANLEVRVSFDGNNAPTGIGGSLVLTSGVIDYQSVKISEFGASLALGQNECYLAATARMNISDYEAAGGVFFGRTACSMAPLLLVDPDLGTLLGSPPFTGAYIYAETWLPLSEVLAGVPSTCMFNVSAGIGAGVFYFAEGPTFGGRMKLGLGGEVLCAATIKAEINMVGALKGDDMVFLGKGLISGEIGKCPVCLPLQLPIGVRYQDGKWSMEEPTP